MRKLFWCSVAVAVSTACGVYLASKSVEHSPVAVVAQALINAGEEAASPDKGTVEGGALPAPPTEEPGSKADSEPVSPVVAVADPATQGTIIFHEEGPMTGTAPPVPLSGPMTTAQAPAPAATLMPYCKDDDEPGLGKMPYAGEEESEPHDALQAPLRQAARAAVTDPMGTADEEQPAKTEEQIPEETRCPEDQGHHDIVCPYTGRSYPEYPIAPAAPEPVKEPAPTNNDTPKKEPQESQSKKISVPEVNDEMTWKEKMDQSWPTFSLDTMEFRPSDAGFQPLVPGPF